MELSTQQRSALDAVRDWIKDPHQQVFRLFGYAGTGKTTIAREFEKTVGGKVLYAAFTGKAASVLQKKGCAATTIHRLIYTPFDPDSDRLEELELELLAEQKKDPQDRDYILKLEELIQEESDRMKQPSFSLRFDSPLADAALLVVDEVSMVGRQMAKDLLSFGRKILVLGDPAQLPPVGDSGFFIDAEPDFLLTEIHRQAADSPVLRLATSAREGRPLDLGDYGTSAVVPVGRLDVKDVAEFDQVIVGRNKTRRDVNRAIRFATGRKDPLPIEGDKLVALRNDYDRGVLNGSQWTVHAAEAKGEDVVWMQIIPIDGGPAQTVTAWAHNFTGREKDLRPWDMALHLHLDFGYAITAHKAQGSQWDRVLVIDESKVFRADAKRWLYTALTRAAESVTVVQKP
jgi:exodeoxyribonuclease-5